MPKKTQAEKDATRLKSESFHMRMTQAQKKTIQANMKLGNYANMNDYLCDIGMYGYFLSPEYEFTEPVRKCAYELNKIGVNVNQIAHRVNSMNVLTEFDFKELMSCLEECKEIINRSFDFFIR